MKTKYQRMSRQIISPAILILTLAASAVLGQQPAGRTMLEVTSVSVKPEMVNDFENLIKTEYNPAFIKGGGKQSNVWRTAGFGNAFEFVFVEPIEKLSLYDGPSPLAKALGNKGAAAFFAKASKMVTDVHSFAIEYRPDLGFTTNMAGPPKMAVISHARIAQGRNTEFENFIKNDWAPVIKQAGVKGYLVHQVVFGGNVNEYITVTFADNYAELEKGPPVARVLGMDGMTKLMQKLPAGTIVNLERYVAAYSPELSVMQQVSAVKQ